MAIVIRSLQNPNWKVIINEQPTRVGRSADNQCVLPDAVVSRHHAILQMEGGIPVITDLNSSRGTFVNGVRVTRSAIKPGDLINFGPLQFQVGVEADAVQFNSPMPATELEGIRIANPDSSKKQSSKKVYLWYGLATVLLVAALAFFAFDPFGVLKPASPPVASVSNTAAAPVTAPIAADNLLVTKVEDVNKAVIRIDATIEMWSFDMMKAEPSMNGTGFIIDPSGIAVTNNHVVTGNGFLKVYVGDDPKPYNVRVLGVSECADLAVLKIEGKDFHYLQFDTTPVKIGTKVYAAGFPVPELKYTLTNGIVSKDNTDGETYWASVDSVLEHTASLTYGNSGGPLLNENLKVIGVNYAGRKPLDQYFAITASEIVSKYLTTLKSEKDLESIGINGEAVRFDSNPKSPLSGLSGIGVYSVRSGSSADKAGIKGGMLITKAEGVLAASQQEMADMEPYCQTLRGHKSTDVLKIEVFDSRTNQYYCGMLNQSPLTPGKCR